MGFTEKMQTSMIRFVVRKILTIMILLCGFMEAISCTIISGTDQNHHTWAGNNEDWIFDFDTWINVLPAEPSRFGAITFTYDDPKNTVQGGLNDQGLFFDYNALPEILLSAYKGWEEKQDFPGGDEAFVLHILQKASTVQQVLDLLEKYRAPGLVGAQMHLADKQGNLAIVNADKIQLSKNGIQITTNFNVLTQSESAEAKTCWRFPIAKQLSEERGASLDTFREILDRTQPLRYGSTVYSNIHNLTTGDFYLYYAGDFTQPVHLNVNDLLAGGKKSYLMRSFFTEHPIVKLKQIYDAQGAEKAIQEYRQSAKNLSPRLRQEALRHMFLNRLYIGNQYADARLFYEEWLRQTEGKDPASSYYGAIVYLTHGELELAKRLLEKQEKIDATEPVGGYGPRAGRLLKALQGTKAPDANVRFELKGYQDAKFVGVYGIAISSIHAFLLKTPKGWVRDFALPPGKIHYGFMVDGKLVLDPANSNTEMHSSAVSEWLGGPRPLNVRIVE